MQSRSLMAMSNLLMRKKKAVKPKRSDAPSCKVGNITSDDGKPTANDQGIVEKWQRSRRKVEAQT